MGVPREEGAIHPLWRLLLLKRLTFCKITIQIQSGVQDDPFYDSGKQTVRQLPSGDVNHASSKILRLCPTHHSRFPQYPVCQHTYHWRQIADPDSSSAQFDLLRVHQEV